MKDSNLSVPSGPKRPLSEEDRKVLTEAARLLAGVKKKIEEVLARA